MKMKSSRDWRQSTTYGPSKTIPGQSLIPADLMKRHLAGTLPDLDQSQRYEYHYDENGVQIAEPMPLEMYEVHNLAVALRKRQFEEATLQRKAKAEKDREAIIQAYLKEQQAKKDLESKPETPPVKPTQA